MADISGTTCPQSRQNHPAGPSKGAATDEGKMELKQQGVALPARPTKESELSDNRLHKKQEATAPVVKVRTFFLLMHDYQHHTSDLVTNGLYKSILPVASLWSRISMMSCSVLFCRLFSAHFSICAQMSLLYRHVSEVPVWYPQSLSLLYRRSQVTRN